jgi:hypothetical protein
LATRNIWALHPHSLLWGILDHQLIVQEGMILTLSIDTNQICHALYKKIPSPKRFNSFNSVDLEWDLQCKASICQAMSWCNVLGIDFLPADVLLASLLSIGSRSNARWFALFNLSIPRIINQLLLSPFNKSGVDLVGLLSDVGLPAWTDGIVMNALHKERFSDNSRRGFAPYPGCFSPLAHSLICEVKKDGHHQKTCELWDLVITCLESQNGLCEVSLHASEEFRGLMNRLDLEYHLPQVPIKLGRNLTTGGFFAAVSRAICLAEGAALQIIDVDLILLASLQLALSSAGAILDNLKHLEKTLREKIALEYHRDPLVLCDGSHSALFPPTIVNSYFLRGGKG